MATQLFLRIENTTRLSECIWTNGAQITLLSGSAGDWARGELHKTRGGPTTTNLSASTVTGPTPGVESKGAGASRMWVSPPINQDITISGSITINIWASESSMSANVAINARIMRLQSDGTVTEIAKSTNTTELGTSQSANNFTVTPTSTAFNRGDRIGVFLFGDDSSGANMATGFTFNISYNGATASADGDTYITFTETFDFDGANNTTILVLKDTAASGGINPGSATEKEAWTGAGASNTNSVTNTAAGPTSPIQLTATAGGSQIEWYTRPLQAVTLSGAVYCDLRMLASVAGTATVRMEIARVDNDGTNATSWGWGGGGSESLNTWIRLTASEAAVQFMVSGDDLAIADGQRLRIRLHIDDFAGYSATSQSLITGRTVTLSYNRTDSGSFLWFPVALVESVSSRVPYVDQYRQILAQ